MRHCSGLPAHGSLERLAFTTATMSFSHFGIPVQDLLDRLVDLIAEVSRICAFSCCDQRGDRTISVAFVARLSNLQAGLPY